MPALLTTPLPLYCTLVPLYEKPVGDFMRLKYYLLCLMLMQVIVVYAAEDQRVRGERLWDASFGFSWLLSHGNTSLSTLRADVYLNRNRRWIDEWTLRVSGVYSTDKDLLSARRGSFVLRYGLSITTKLYTFMRLPLDHDYTANIDLRLVPTLGIGYWFVDTKAFQSMVESGLGYKQSYFSNATEEGSSVLQFRALSVISLGTRSKLTLDAFLFPETTTWENYVVNARTAFDVDITAKLKIGMEYRIEYNSNPFAGTEKLSGWYTTRFSWKF
jgi:putative salt-induced outer membrane protein YdiY